MLGFAETDRDVTPREGEPVALEPLPQSLPVPEISGRAQLDAVVTSPRNRVEDALWIGHVRQNPDGDLERAVAARRIRDADAGQPRRPSVVTSGTRGSGSSSLHAGRIQASAGSSAAAIERRSPARPFR